jgi:5'-nucleotidase
MRSPRRALVALAAPVAALSIGLSIGLAPGADSVTPSTKAGTTGAAAYKKAVKGKKKDYVKLDLLALNDFHGNLEAPTGNNGNIPGITGIKGTPAGGAAQLASLLNSERKKSRANGASTLTVAAGDLIGASPLLSAAFHDEPTIKAMNLMRLDASAVGNHEFDEGVDELLRMQKGGCLPDGAGANGQDSCPGGQDFKGADFKYLGANVFWKNAAGKSRPTPFKPYTIKKVQGQKVGFIGMTLEGTPAIVSAAGIANVDFKDEVETANALVPQLKKKGVKSIIVLLHEGVTPTDATSYNSCTGVTGPALAIAQNLSPKIDAVVSGHTHQPYNCVVKDPAGKPRLLTSASSFGRMVTKLHFLIDPKTHDIVRPAAYAENIINANSEGQPQNKKVLSLIDTFKTLVQPIANKVIGHIGTADVCTGNVQCVSRTQTANGFDSTLGNLIADSQRVDPTIVSGGKVPVVAFMNPGGIRADLLENPAGDVTYGAAFTVQPFNNFVVSMDLTGAQIKAVLNEQWTGANKPTSAGISAGSNKILQVSGLQYTFDVSEANAGSTNGLVGQVMIDDDGNAATPMVPISDTTTYRVAANNFLSDGGDNFATFKAGTNKLIGGLDIDSLVKYLALPGNDPYNVTATDRISSQP